MTDVKMTRSVKVLLLLALLKGVTSLKSLEIHVPKAVQSGETVTLRCDYDLEEVALYSIKWYWNEKEFYRYVPKESPPFRAFSMKHVNVDLSRSGPTEVTLRGVRRELSGAYECEVSADAPLFHTDIKKAHMVVADLPNGDPVMNIETGKVEIGKRIRAECFSPGSNPAANITWYINDEKASDFGDAVRIHTNQALDKALMLQSSKSTIEVVANKSFFYTGLMTLKCEASLLSIWRKSVEDYVRDDTPQLAPVLGSSSQSQTDDFFEILMGCSPEQSLEKVLLWICLLLVLLR